MCANPKCLFKDLIITIKPHIILHDIDLIMIIVGMKFCNNRMKDLQISFDAFWVKFHFAEIFFMKGL